jgi:hypothetical protein
MQYWRVSRIYEVKTQLRAYQGEPYEMIAEKQVWVLVIGGYFLSSSSNILESMALQK